MKFRLALSILGVALLAGLMFLWLAVYPANPFTLLFDQLSGRSAYYADIFPQPRAAYDFQLVNEEGKPFRLDQLRGKVVLLTFGFTHCPNICPTTLGDLAGVYRALPPALQQKTGVVFISVDPSRDTPSVLKSYIPFFEEHFIGLTGDPSAIAQTAKEYGVAYEKDDLPGANGSKDYTISHTAYVFLISPGGKWIGLYRHEQLGETKRIASDIERIVG